MKKLLIATGVVAGLLMVTGCSKKEKQPPQPPPKKVEKPQKKVEAPKGPSPEELERARLAKLKAQIQQEIPQVVIYFDFDKYNIKESEAPKVEQLAELLKKYPGAICVKIEGNTDEWGTEEYNTALGLKRANSVKDALIKAGVNGNYLAVVSNGETNPVCQEHNRECWAKNRRDNFVIGDGNSPCPQQ